MIKYKSWNSQYQFTVRV